MNKNIAQISSHVEQVNRGMGSRKENKSPEKMLSESRKEKK